MAFPRSVFLILIFLPLILSDVFAQRVHVSEVEDKFDRAILDNKPFSGILYDTFEDDKIKSEAEFLDGLPHGMTIIYYDNYYEDMERASIKKILNYKHGKLHGEYLTFYEPFLYIQGEKHIEANYNDGEKHGLYIDHTQEGEIWTIIEYETGEVKVVKEVNHSFSDKESGDIGYSTSGWIKFSDPKYSNYEFYIHADDGELEDSPFFSVQINKLSGGGEWKSYSRGIYTDGEARIYIHHSHK